LTPRRSSFAVALIVLPLLAAGRENSHPAHTRVSLVAEEAWIQPGRPFWVAVRLEMDPGWHTYWKNPGDSGAPTRVEWRLPEGFSAGPLRWPAPRRLGEPPVVNFGYEGKVALLSEVTPPAKLSARSATLRASVKWMECEKECLPGEDDVELVLRVKPDVPPLDPEAAEFFAAMRRRFPRKSLEWKFLAQTRGENIRLRIFPSSRERWAAMTFFPERRGVIDHSAPQGFGRTGGGYRLDLPMAEAVAPPDALQGVLTVERYAEEGGGAEAFEVDTPVEPGPEPAPGLWLFLGGSAVLVAAVLWIVRHKKGGRS
jgi:DsbC/DsbD-like thiol-disulfide interchange protein